MKMENFGGEKPTEKRPKGDNRGNTEKANGIMTLGRDAKPKENYLFNQTLQAYQRIYSLTERKTAKPKIAKTGNLSNAEEKELARLKAFIDSDNSTITPEQHALAQEWEAKILGLQGK
jgi:hypothetical protein